MDSRDIEQIDARLRDAFLGELPDASAVEHAVRKRMGEERLRQWMMLAAAVILLAVAGYLVSGRMYRARIYAEMARDHRREVVQREPRHWRADPAEIEVLAERYGLTASQPIALAPAGYWLEHAKTCGLDGQPVLHLVYTNGTREFSVYVRKRRGVGFSGVGRIESEQVAAIRTDRFEAAVVAVGSADECTQFARRAARVL
jgi:hypothetical protein